MKKRVAIGYAYSGKNIGGVRKHIENINKLSSHTTTLFPNHENDLQWKKTYDMKIRDDHRNYIKNNQQEIIDKYDIFHSSVDPTFIKLCEEAQKQGKKWVHTYHSFVQHILL